LYKLGDVERLLGLPRSTLQALVRAGFVTPTRGARNAQLFSFQDLIVFRTAQSLARAGVPPRSIARAMKKLRGRSASGQYSLEFGGAPAARTLGARPAPKPLPPETVEERINHGLALHEAGRLEEAAEVYRSAIESGSEDPVLLFNLGVLLEDMGRPEDAVIAYRASLNADPRDADCHFNLALLYEYLGKPKDAIRHMAQYRRLTSARK
jgi:tetratricopeptide (TPR) repeat protein